MPPRIKHFAWRIATGSLPTKKNKMIRHMETVGMCDICGLEDESEAHALLRCPRARDIMQAMRQSWNLPDIRVTEYDGKGWLLHLLDRWPTNTRDKLLLVLWRIWYVRNQMIHNDPDHSVRGSVLFLESYHDSLLMAQQQQMPMQGTGKQKLYQAESSTNARRCRPWVRPSAGHVKINVDAAFFQDSGRAGVGVIARDDEGGVILSSGQVLFNCADAEEAEVLACREGVALALQWIDKPVVIETDCLTVCAALKSSSEDRSKLALLLREIKVLANELREVEFNHCNRNQNRVSHILANKACVDVFTKVWVGSFPDFVATAIAIDCNPVEH